MIVFANALLASTTLTQPLAHPRIAYQTFTRDLAASAVTASTSDDNGPKDAPLRPDTAEYWQPTALPATWVVDLGAGREIDYVGVAGHDLCTQGCAIEVETSTNGVDWTDFATGIAPANDGPLLFLDDLRVARYVRLSLTGGADMPRLAVVYVGEALAMPVRITESHTPITLSRETVLHQSLSRGGQFLAQGYRRMGVTGAVTFRHLEQDFVRDELDLFIREARRYPYFFAWQPEEFSDEVAYVWTPEDIVPSYEGGIPLMQVSWPMRGIGNP